MKTTRLIKHVIVIAAAVGLSGCVIVAGQFNGLSSDPMTMMFVVRTDGQRPTKEQYDAVVAVAKEMGAQIGIQISSPAEAGVTSAAVGAIAGVVDRSAITSGIGAAAGGATGIAAYSYANVFAVADATDRALRDREAAGQTIFKNVHAISAFVRSRNTEESMAQ